MTVTDNVPHFFFGFFPFFYRVFLEDHDRPRSSFLFAFFSSFTGFYRVFLDDHDRQRSSFLFVFFSSFTGFYRFFFLDDHDRQRSLFLLFLFSFSYRVLPGFRRCLSRVRLGTL